MSAVGIRSSGNILLLGRASASILFTPDRHAPNGACLEFLRKFARRKMGRACFAGLFPDKFVQDTMVGWASYSLENVVQKLMGRLIKGVSH